MSRSRRAVAGLVVVAIALAGCTRPDDTATDTSTLPTATTSEDASGGATTTDATDATGSTPPTTTPPTTPSSTDVPSSTAPPSTAPSSTAAPGDSTARPSATTAPPDDLTLFFDGVVPYRFGDRDVDVVPGLAALLGEPVGDDDVEYTTADEGVFLDETGETSFVFPHGRTVCYPNDLCVEFGAGAPETLIFTGWRVGDGAPSDLTTDGGIAIGSTLADHSDQISFDPLESCFQVAYGAVDGVDVTLMSDDGPFATPNPDGDGVELGDPDPALVTVQSMSAGELPIFRAADC